MNATQPISKRRAAAAGRGMGLAAFVVVGAILQTPTRADMLRPVPTPGGIDSRPVITSVKRSGGNVTVNFHGLEAPYQLEVTAGVAAPAWSNAAPAAVVFPNYDSSVILRNLAGAQNFCRIGMTNNTFLGYNRCTYCHDNKISAWQQTPHATAINSVLKLPPAQQAACLPCHSVGFGQPNGFVNTNATPQLANVGCECCHGPAGAHVTLNGLQFHPVRTAASEVCGGCHDTSQSPLYSDWKQSGHAAVTPTVAAAFADTPAGQNSMMRCGVCHSGAVRLAMLNNTRDQFNGLTNYLALPSAHDAAGFGQTCAVCHDPHTVSTNGFQLRGPKTSTNFFTFYAGSVSTDILGTNVFGQVTTNTLFSNTSFATQAVATAQVQICAQCHNSEGAAWTDTAYPPHYSLQYNMLLGNVGELGSNQPPYQPSHHAVFFTNQCLDCHMQSQPYQNPTTPAVSGHKFTVENFDLCVPCHGPYASNLVQFAYGVFLPSEAQRVKAALDLWATTKAPTSLQTKYGRRAWEYTHPGSLSTGGPGPDATEQALIPDDIKRARFNLYLFNNDGAAGIHNPNYVLTLGDAALNWVQIELNK